ncbi:MAG: class I SAM-dependent methyltransferase [Flavobacteriaceae bacterium]|jgi:SAM-dependent methyltransferase|nr:class I SAM-dependent methyltransferase [Flavobacteriaceae bacterium]
METNKEWFKDWFDTDFYHILYDERNDEEAELFMKNLASFLKLTPKQTILDMPCGKGRHAIFLNSLGFTVTGADLSKNNLKLAGEFKNENLSFIQHDMREPLPSQYDVIVNLFTSFGYFDDAVNSKVLQHLKNGLKTNGILVIDFLNVEKVRKSIVKQEVITKNDINFYIDKTISGGFIIKKIMFSDDGKKYNFEERVRYITLQKFEAYFVLANLKVKHTFGDYHLNPFDPESSERLIMILE